MNTAQHMIAVMRAAAPVEKLAKLAERATKTLEGLQ